MATKTVVFFTAGINPTTNEKTAIGKLNAAAEPAYKVLVVNGAANAKYGETDRLIPTDFAAGTIPTIYNAVPVLDPNALGGVTVTNGQTVAVRNSAGANSHNATAVVTGGTTLVGVNLAATAAIVDNAATLPVTGGGTVTFTVAGGVVTGIAYTAP